MLFLMLLKQNWQTCDPSGLAGVFEVIITKHGDGETEPG